MSGIAASNGKRDLVATIFAGTGELACRCRAFDWAATPLGPVEQWPQALRTVAQTTLPSIFPTIILWGPELVQIYNDGYRALMGVKHPAGLGQPTRDCWPEVWHINAPIYDRVFQGETFSFEDALYPITRSGALADAWFSLAYAPIRDESGAVGGVFVTVQETTAAHAARAPQAERETLVDQLSVESNRLAEIFRQAPSLHPETESARQKAEAVLASIADPFFLLDPDWRFTYVNGAAPPLLQKTPEELLGRTLWEVFPELVGSSFEAAYFETMTTGRATSVEAYYAPLEGWFDVHTYRWAEGLMVHFREVSARKVAEAELERLLAVAKSANQAKVEFLGVMSHELRTPLNAIAGYTELIEMGVYGPVTPEQRAALERVQRSQRHLLGLINGVLNYAKIDAGAVLYQLTDISLYDILSTCEVLTAPQMLDKELTFRFAGCDAGLTARADSEKVQQIVLNLLSNAIKFTHLGGGVTLACCADGRERVIVRVTDTGSGIAADQFERVFLPFVQVDAKLTRSKEGTGLGLAISRELARGMGGDLTLASEPGVGSTFTLTLPASA